MVYILQLMNVSNVTMDIVMKEVRIVSCVKTIFILMIQVKLVKNA